MYVKEQVFRKKKDLRLRIAGRDTGVGEASKLGPSLTSFFFPSRSDQPARRKCGYLNNLP